MQGSLLRFGLLLALGACTTGRAVPARKPATTELGWLVVEAAGDQRCEAAMTMLEAVGEDDAAYRQELSQDPHVRACAAAVGPATEPKSVELAQSYSMTGALLGPLAMPVGILFGGIIGHRDGLSVGFLVGAVATGFIASGGSFYAPTSLSIVGIGLHAAGVAAMAWSLTQMFGGGDSDEGGGGPDVVSQVFFAGLASYAAGTVWDLGTAGRRVRDWNREHGAVQVVPTATAHSAGLALTGRF
jgi:hypothetical protein